MTDHTNAYAPFFKGWQVKALGPKPTNEQLAAVHGLGARPGKQALAIAMGLRDVGVSNSQIIMACGNPQLNKMRGFITDAFLKRDMTAPPNEHGHTVYKLAVTKKGEARIERDKAKAAALEAAGNTAAERPAKAVAKPKGKVKAKRAAKVTVTEMPTVDLAGVTVADVEPTGATLPTVEM